VRNGDRAVRDALDTTRERVPEAAVMIVRASACCCCPMAREASRVHGRAAFGRIHD